MTYLNPTLLKSVPDTFLSFWAARELLITDTMFEMKGHMKTSPIRTLAQLDCIISRKEDFQSILSIRVAVS